MLLFGHIGITLGAALVLDKVMAKKTVDSQTVSALPDEPAVIKHLRCTRLAGMDLKAVVVGSMLPDIIDKPVGQVLFRETFSNGRIIFHTLLILAVIALAGTYLYRRKKNTLLLALSFGFILHLILDAMWQSPQTLFWPLYGFAFPKIELDGWTQTLFQRLLGDPGVYIPEIIGLGIIIYFAISSIHQKKFRQVQY